MTFRPKYITFDCYGTLTYFPMHQVAYDIYEGQELHGSPRMTLSRGTVVFDDGKIVTTPGHGRFVRRSTFSPRDI